MGLIPYTFLAFAIFNIVTAEILTPPYFNLAEGSSIEATATCGVNITTPEERFCRLTGASADEIQEISGSSYYSGNSVIIAGQLCDFCIAEGAANSAELESQVHSAEYAIDGTERWWQSPPLSRGEQFNDVNLTVDLGQEFHIAYVYMKMGNSPRPGVWSLERSTDNGKTWSTWQNFADSIDDCMLFFNQRASTKPTTDDEVICTTEFSKIVPLEGGEIVVSLVQDRPGSTNFSYAPRLQEFTKATNVRLSLQRTKTLLGHAMQIQAQDPTVTRRYFYSVKDISIGGRCVCNGHADVCVKNSDFKRTCECQHNTCGDSCERCCEPFVQKKWRPASEDNENACERCQCFGHATECEYSQDVDDRGLSVDMHGNYDGGGVCQNCTDNTQGINCDQCVHGYYRVLGKSLYDKDVCQPCVCDPAFTTGDCADETGICECLEQYTGPNCQECAFGYYDPPECRKCDCYINGTVGDICEVGGGQCPCKDNFGGETCGKCADGYWNFPECVACVCGGDGAVDNVCDQMSGQCNCEFSFTGLQCDQCQVGFYDYPSCKLCACDVTGTEQSICDSNSGECICKENYVGNRCSQCADNYYSYPACKPCECDATGTVGGSTLCNDQGQCTCMANFGGKKCDSCAPGYHNHPQCKSCDCNLLGSYGQSCDQESAQCTCRPNFIGLKCSSCAPDFYNFPTCEACLCNPAGALPVDGFPLGGCGSFADGYKLCECKANVEGHTCDQCKAGYYDLTKDNPDGCKPCSCHLPGTLLGDNMCDPVTGQCLCKVNVNSEWCQACIAGTYNLQESSVFGCDDCNCDMGGSISGVCNDLNGQCICRPRVEGRTCSKPLANHYFPTLHQLKYELEDGYNPTDDDSAVRFGFKDTDFPGFSWRGYAVFSRIQPEVRVMVDIEKPSLFKLIFRYMNRNFEPVEAEVIVTPEDPAEQEQTATVKFPVTGSLEPKFFTTDTPLVLSPGKWTIAVKTDSDLKVRSDHIFVDYLVLLPQAYYEGAILQDRLRNPCMVPSDGKECLHYTYLDLSKFNQLNGGDATTPSGTDLVMETNRDILLPLNSPELAIIDDAQPELIFDMELKEPGRYVVVVGYTSPLPSLQTVTVTMKPQGENATVGKAMLYECEYSSLCRQVVIDMDGGQQMLDTPTVNVTVTIEGDDSTIASIGYLAAVPEEQWKDEMVKGQVMCVQVDGNCVEGSYPSFPGSRKMDVTVNVNTSSLPGADDKKLAKLDTTNTLMVRFTDLTSQSYALVASYYQTDDVGFPVNVTVDVNGVMYTGYFDASYCPNTAGCNSIVTFDDILIQNQIIDVLSPDAVVNIKPLTRADANVWMDYVQMVPTKNVETLVPLFELMDPYDLSSKYISECTENSFYHDPESGQITPFCRSSIFSVTTEYNNGALYCDCDAQGSDSFQCSEFGGQCRCKSNVIGRTCNACAQNYWGFPNCQPCNCPAATCNAVTGACECPKKVVGDNCDQCAPQTFGYDATIGCMDCNCEPEGVLNGNLNCDPDLGSCDCKPNVVGRTCDVCKDGHWNYPSCDACNCDPAGTTQSICNKDTSRCNCKTNTGGAACGECQPGTYNLEARNHEGCTACFCFGIASSCRSSSLLRSEILNMSGWELNVNNNLTEVKNMDDMAMADLADDDAVRKTTLYWVAPEPYLGNRLTSYGGQIKYTIGNHGVTRADSPSRQRLAGADIQLSGKGVTIIYELLSPILDEEIDVDIIESSWRHADSRGFVTREQLMKVLSAVDELLIKANHYADVPQVSLTSVTLDSAVELDTNSSGNSTGVSQSFSADIALSVEMCSCPYNYTGTSCEDCADGFYRKINNQGDFVCVACECNEHSQTCDRETGVCSACRGNTEGDHCELCRFGYTGEPLVEDCVICACPMPLESNNFARDCTLSPIDNTQTIQCDCMPGFMPPFCGSCGPGYYGNPRNTSGGNCIPCECNDNIDASNPGSCDSFSGQCLICLNNTQGNNCEECADFYWGDAINAKDCQECDCDSAGTESCDKDTGMCNCKPNVIGDRCDQCAPDTWGFLSGDGCSHCNCSIASNSTQCDIVTGNCMCQPGATGKYCNSCKPQHWDFTADGCKSCECELDGAVGCSVETGVCQCLQGVTGDKCDRCADRWVLIPEQGCEACDNCVHTLLDDTDVLEFDIANASESLRIINIGVEAKKRLELLNLTAQHVKDSLDNVPRRSLDPAELEQLISNLTVLEKQAYDALKDAKLLEALSGDVAADYNTLNANMAATNASKDAVLAQLQDILDYIEKKYQEILDSEQLRDVSRLLREAIAMLANMQERQLEFDMLLSNAQDAEKRANDTLDKVEQWSMETTNLLERFNSISDSLNDTNNRLRDLQEKAEDALKKSDESEENLKNLNDMISELQMNTVAIKKMKEDLEKTIDNAENYNRDANEYIQNSTTMFQQLEQDLTVLEMMVDKLNELYDELSAGNIEARPKVDAAIAYADGLKLQATDLTNLLNETSQAAVKAANASQMIVTSINEAMNASQDALDMAMEAVRQSTDIHNNTEQVRADSVKLLEEAQMLKNDESEKLRERLIASNSTIDGLRETNYEIEQKISESEFNMEALKKNNGAEAEAARLLANRSRTRAEEAVASVQPILNTLDRDMQLVNDVPTVQKQMSATLEKIKTKLATFKDTLPHVTTLTERLTTMMPTLNTSQHQLNTSISALRQKIENARAVANRIKVAVKSNENTTMELRAPEGFVVSLVQQADLSLFFQTEEENGLLMYVGPKAPAALLRAKRATAANVEFMAIELVNGYVVWRFNLGASSAEIISSNTYNDNKWHQVIATRTGKSGTLTVKTHNEKEDTVSGRADGVYNQLDLVAKATRIFAGGVPENFSLPSEVVNRRFIGGLDDYSYSTDQIRLGLWNFVGGAANDEGTQNRGTQLAPVVSDTARFVASSESYITIDQGTLKASSSLIVELTFMTLNKDGILFFMGQDMSTTLSRPDYFKLYMLDGKLYATIELGGGEITAVLDDKMLADGQEHTVLVNRMDNKVFLQIDNTQDNSIIVEGSDKSKQLNLGANPEIHIGGIPKDSKYFSLELAKYPYYDGCISDLSLNNKPKNILSSYLAKVGVVSGCKLTKRGITFLEAPAGVDQSKDTGYVYVHDVIPISENFTVGMRIKTTAQDGLLFYASSQTDDHAFSVALADGRIEVVNTAGLDNNDEAKRNSVWTKDAYNDGGWHSISVVKSALELSITVDDSDRTTTTGEHRGKKTKTHPLFGYYFGGLLPATVNAIRFKNNSAAWTRFVGCMSDVYIKKESIDFAIYRPEGTYADYSTCPVPDPVDPDATTTIAPITMLEPETTETPIQSCVLPREPNVLNVREQGTRFGLSQDSRFEYETIAGVDQDLRKELRISNNVRFMVKTFASEGMIWFIGSIKASADDNPDYTSVYLDKGKVVYKCNLGAGASSATSPQTINDGEWHSVEIKRERKQVGDTKVVEGALIIDEGTPINIAWPSGTTSLNFALPIYVGGLNMADGRYTYMAQKIGLGSAASLVGCIDEMEYRGSKDNSEWMSYGAENKSFSTQGCFENQEDGVFIASTGGSLSLGDQTTIGVNAEVELSVRPRSSSGVVFLVWGGGDYLGIELFEGVVKVNVNNGAGDIVASLPVPNICDGQWRKIRVVKQLNELTLTVALETEEFDESIAGTGKGSSRSTSADTNSPVYIGGIPKEASGSRYQPSSGSESYVGCIRRVTVSGESFNMSRGKKNGDVARTCPTT